jgi:hypothetical protein
MYESVALACGLALSGYDFIQNVGIRSIQKQRAL